MVSRRGFFEINFRQVLRGELFKDLPMNQVKLFASAKPPKIDGLTRQALHFIEIGSCV